MFILSVTMHCICTIYTHELDIHYTVDSLLCIYTLMYASCKHRDAIALYIISN